ncbi:hypothetical protein ACXN5S_02475 [Pseudoroseicyclus sp. H15]
MAALTDRGILHAVYKPAFRLGLTAGSDEVRRRWHEHLIPMALDTFEQVAAERQPGPGVTFTLDSSLIADHLATQPAAAVQRLEAAIEAGGITWHALPMTLHAELLTPELFAEGLGIARQLDERFGRHTRCAAMTGIQGVTVGVVKALAAARVELLLISLDPAVVRPDLPTAFRWRSPAGTEIVVLMPEADGTILKPGDEEIGLAILTGGINAAPPDVAGVLAARRALSQVQPDLTPQFSTLDAFWEALAPARDRLPLVRTEIGDTLIHGTSSAPQRLAGLMAAMRVHAQMAEGPEREAFGRSLLELAEPSWGRDSRVFLPRETAWEPAEFTAARRSDGRFANLEASWAEKDAVLSRAIRALPPADLARISPPPAAPALGPGRALREVETLGDMELTFSPGDGVLRGIAIGGAPVFEARPDGPGLFAYSHRSWSGADYAAALQSFMSGAAPNELPRKPGIAEAGGLSANVTLGSAQVVEQGETLWISTTLSQEAPGAPPRALAGFRRVADGLELELHLLGKPANRLPEAGFLALTPAHGLEPKQIVKMGVELEPRDVVRGGNRQLHAISAVLGLASSGWGYRVTPLDSPLYAPGSHPFLPHGPGLPASGAGGRFVLYNNKASYGYAQWCEGDLSFRFHLALTPPAAAPVRHR